jgi:hypothetical protein
MSGTDSVVPHATQPMADESCGRAAEIDSVLLPAGKPFTGDQSLGRSISFMRDAMFAREMTLATADGDVGRLWEIIKVMVFTFAGSSHSNYTNYLLEMITKIELESDEDLRRALLQLTLVNLSGREGHWSAGDFIQEYFNRLLEAIVQHKGVEYGDTFIRETWSRNIHHVARLKLSWFDAVGLQPRSRRHTGAEQDAEVRILLEHYKVSELHSFHAGRTFDTEPYVDDFQKGIQKLQNGKLQKWVHKTTNSRLKTSLTDSTSTILKGDLDPASDGDSDACSDGDSDTEESTQIEVPRQDGPLVFPTSVGGALVLKNLDIEQDINILLAEESDSEAGGSEDENVN